MSKYLVKKLFKKKSNKTFDLKKKDEKNFKFRSDIEMTLRAAPTPSYWGLKPNDGVKTDFSYILVDLNPNSDEYRTIYDEFMFRFYQFVPKYFYVQRIENHGLFSKYYAKQLELSRPCPPSGNELMLFHGTRSKNVDGICRNGFNLDMSRPDGNK
jgi:hypothetical protein